MVIPYALVLMVTLLGSVDCVACQYVWYQVELEVGNDQIEENIYDAFTQTCIDAQKAPIFYPAVPD